MSISALKPTLINFYENNKFPLVAALTVLFLLTLLDSERFIFTVKTKQKQTAISNVEPLALQRLSDADIVSIEKAYENFEHSEELKQAEKVQLMSAAEQEKQQGELVSLFVGDNKLKLKAVVRYNKQSAENTGDHAYYALIETENLTKGERVVQKYQHKDDIFGYQLIIKQNQQVQLVAKKAGVQRIINLVMYQKSNNALKKNNEQALSNQNNIKKSSE